MLICESPKHYNQFLENDREGLCETKGGEDKQIKPITDIVQFNTDTDIEAFKTDLNVMFPNKAIILAIKGCKRQFKGN